MLKLRSKLKMTSESPVLVLFAMLAVTVPAGAQRVITSQYDNARTGANTSETILTPRNVNAQQFGKIFTLRVDGNIYVQPLFLGGVEIPGKGRHDVLFVATEHDSVYAFDAYGKPASPLWQVSFLKDGVTSVPARNVECPFILPEVGITSTPVIDAESGTLYVLARTKETHGLLASEYHQRLHALAITTGMEKFGGSVDIQAFTSGKGAASFGTNKLNFDPLTENPRAALLLANGMVYMTWGSSCDVGPYHGWAMAYDALNLKQMAVFNASPDADDSGFWASDTGPAEDGHGNVIVATGNGRFDVAKGGRDYGDSLLKLNGKSLKVEDYFAPFNVDALEREDGDLGSGGPVLLPDQPGPHPRLAVVAGKGGTVYLIDRDRMGHYQPASDSHAVQAVPGRGGVYGSMAYWNHNLYVLSDGESDALRDFAVKDGRLSLKASSGTSQPGICATPVVSANGAKDGVLWMLRSKSWNGEDTPATLIAFDAENITHQLYSSEQNATRDRAGLSLRFNIPTVVNGRVYVGAQREVDVYGLLSAALARK
jgi:hypothetical protein